MPTRNLPPAAARFLRIITWAENTLLILLLTLMVGLAGTQILFRNLLDLSFLGVDQLLRLLVLWVAMLGAVAASRNDKHINVDMLSRFLPPRLRAGARILTDLFTIGICVLLTWHAARFVADERAANITAFGSLPMWMAELILPAAFALIALRYLLHVRHHLLQALGREDIA